MFPHSYTYNPGVVLDPVTMTPMITHGGNITVNPLGVPMRPQQKVWQKMFIKNIPQECTNEIMIRLLNEFGAIKNFKRTLDNRSKPLPFCHFELQTGEEILRIRRLFLNIKILQGVLDLKISAQTQNFLKEWMTMQKDQWRKKLLAPGMNQAKQYESIQHYQLRDDKKYKVKIEDTLRQINTQVKKLAVERMRQQERKEHPKQKQRQKTKKKNIEQLDRNFNQKEDQWLRRQREKQKEYRRQKEKEKERQKQRTKRLQKQINLEDQEIERKIYKYITEERIKQIKKEEEEDNQIMLEENPPLPEQQAEMENRLANARKVRVTMEEQIKLGDQKVEQVIVQAPKMSIEQNRPQKQLQKNQLFEGYQHIYDQQRKDKAPVELNLPEIPHEEVDEQEQKRRKEQIKQLQSKIPQNKMELWQFPIDWVKLSKSVILQKNIRPWLQETSIYYMGGVQQKFIALVQKKLLSRSHPDKIIKILKQLLDVDSQQFVIKLWKKLVFQYLKLQNNLI